MRVQGIASVFLGIMALVAAGCAEPPTTMVVSGTAEIRVDASMLANHGITQVVVEASGYSADLVYDSNTGSFVGVLVLPVGSHDLVASAYDGTTEVGVSHPTTVEIQSGVVTRVTIRILDLTGGEQPDFGPIVVSLTHPASAEVGATVSFSVVVVDPDGDPVSIAWTDDCADSTFTDAQAATTGWSKASAGTCRVTVTASSGFLSASESFSIVVFPPGATTGAADVEGIFVAAPSIYLDLSYARSCSVYEYVDNASCPGYAASPEYVYFSASVWNWGNSTPGSIDLVDSCGGAVHIEYTDANYIYGRWLPPTQGQVCLLTASAISGDGVSGTLSAALLVRDGTPRIPTPPYFWADIYHSTGGCSITSDWGSVDCGLVQSGDVAYVGVYVDWFDGFPGEMVLTDDCGGVFDMLPPGSNHVEGFWNVPVLPGRVCNVSVRVTNSEGISSQEIGTFQTF